MKILIHKRLQIMNKLFNMKNSRICPEENCNKINKKKKKKKIKEKKINKKEKEKYSSIRA